MSSRRSDIHRRRTMTITSLSQSDSGKTNHKWGLSPFVVSFYRAERALSSAGSSEAQMGKQPGKQAGKQPGKQERGSVGQSDADPATIGARIRRVRDRQGISVRQLAALASVGKNTVSRI